MYVPGSLEDQGSFKLPIRPSGFCSTGSREGLADRPDHYLRHFRGGWHRKGNIPEKHPDGLSETVIRQRIANTSAMVDLIDQNIGKILQELENQQLTDNTIIIFTTDHGELMGDYGLWNKGPFYFQSLINIPFIMSVPGGVKNVTTDALFSHIDLVPTLCDLIGHPTELRPNGISQKDILLGRKKNIRDHCLVEYRNGYGENDMSSKALVTQDWKYVYYQNNDEELTDLANDTDEAVNLAGDPACTEVKEEMRLRLLQEVLSTEQKSPEQTVNA
mgnify:FL=1